MFDWHEFNVAFQNKSDHSPDQKQVEAVQKHRKELGGTLFFDRIWNSLGLKHPNKSYPAKSNQELRVLWTKIVQSPAADEQKLALLYYILHDCRLNNNEERFLRKTGLPEKYQLLVTGLWELDHCQFSRALEYLTDPSLTPTFADEILSVLLQHPKCDQSLAMAYYITINPPLRNENTLASYFSLLAQTNVLEAYYFTKSHAKHKQLFEELVESIHEEDADTARADRAVQLIGLPFTDEEQTWFEDCLLHGSGAKLKNGKDSILMRRIIAGKRTTENGAVDRYQGVKIDGVTWDDLRNISVT